MHNLKGGNAIPVRMQPYNAASTDIRHIVNQNGNTALLLPDSVEAYITKHKLY